MLEAKVAYSAIPPSKPLFRGAVADAVEDLDLDLEECLDLEEHLDV